MKERIEGELRICERLITMFARDWGNAHNKDHEKFCYQTISGYRYTEEVLNRILEV